MTTAAHDTTAYRPLPTEFGLNGYWYTLVCREGDVAIYKQGYRGLEEAAAYEVILIRREPATTICGREVPARERAPKDAEWGSWGWTCHDLPRAKEKMRELLDAAPGSVSRGN